MEIFKKDPKNSFSLSIIIVIPILFAIGSAINVSIAGAQLISPDTNISNNISPQANSSGNISNNISPQANSSGNIPLKFYPFNNNQSISLSTVGLLSSPVYILRGDTTSNNEGFYAYKHFDGNYLALTTGNINKLSTDENRGEPQFTILFKIKGMNSDYNMTFINGRATTEGWVDNNFYIKMEPNSIKLVSLLDLLATKNDRYQSIEQVIVTLERDTRAFPITFDIDFIRSVIP